MRPLLTLVDDIAAKLKSVVRRIGRAFRDVVNDPCRRGLDTPQESQTRPPFAVRVRDLGSRRPALDLDNITDLLDQVEGPLHR